MSSSKDYILPEGGFISRSKETERLYDLEEKRSRAIEAAAKSLGRVLEHSPQEYWTRTLPEALLAVLDSHDSRATRLAAIAHLKREIGNSIVRDPEQTTARELKALIEEHILPLFKTAENNKLITIRVPATAKNKRKFVVCTCVNGSVLGLGKGRWVVVKWRKEMTDDVVMMDVTLETMSEFKKKRMIKPINSSPKSHE